MIWNCALRVTLVAAALLLVGCTAGATTETRSDETTTQDPTAAPEQALTEECGPGFCVTATRHVAMSSQTITDVYARTDVYATEDPPVVVLLHGTQAGGYGPLAEAVAREDVVVFNATWRSAAPPLTAVQDAACAVRFARANATDYGGDPTRVVLAGHSSGASIAMVVALAGDQFEGDCLAETTSALPDAVVGLAGSYDPEDHPGDPRNALRDSDPALYQALNPVTHLGANPELRVRLLHGQADAEIPVEASINFHQMLLDAGYEVQLTVLEEVGHTLQNPISAQAFAATLGEIVGAAARWTGL